MPKYPHRLGSSLAYPHSQRANPEPGLGASFHWLTHLLLLMVHIADSLIFRRTGGQHSPKLNQVNTILLHSFPVPKLI